MSTINKTTTTPRLRLQFKPGKQTYCEETGKPKEAIWDSLRIQTEEGDYVLSAIAKQGDDCSCTREFLEFAVEAWNARIAPETSKETA